MMESLEQSAARLLEQKRKMQGASLHPQRKHASYGDITVAHLDQATITRGAYQVVTREETCSQCASRAEWLLFRGTYTPGKGVLACERHRGDVLRRVMEGTLA